MDMVNNKESKQVISAKVPAEILTWFRKEADKANTTVSRFLALHLRKIMKKGLHD